MAPVTVPAVITGGADDGFNILVAIPVFIAVNDAIFPVPSPGKPVAKLRAAIASPLKKVRLVCACILEDNAKRNMILITVCKNLLIT